MKRLRIRFGQRRGAIAPLTALLLIPLLGMVAFAVDLGYLMLVKTELQHTADAAALAGAQKLMTPYTQWLVSSNAKNQIRTDAIAAAKQAAKTYATYNVAGQVNITLLDSDIEVGFLDSSGNYNANPPTTTFPNTVRVVARRDGQQNGTVTLFFARVLGVANQDLQTSARATIYTAKIDGFSSTAPTNGWVLPVVYDVNDWNNFIATGQNADGGTTTDSSGKPTLQVYPSIKDTGNFGGLALDGSHAGASEIRDWVNNGLPGGSVQTLNNMGLLPLSSHDSSSWDWVGDPGLKTSVIMAVNAKVGKEYILPLCAPYSDDSEGVGNGSHYYYQIVRFVTVTIMPSTNGGMIVQPTGYVDPTTIYDRSSVKPAGTDTSIPPKTTLTYPRLNQ